MAGGLINTNENLNLFNEQVDKSMISVDRLGSALKSLSNILPIQDVMKLQDGFANLNRTLALSSSEVTKLNKAVDTLATQTSQYSRVELGGMIAAIAKSNSALCSNIANVEKLTKAFSNAYKQGAPQFLQLYVKMNETLPQLQARTDALSDSVTTLNEVFKVGGKEGLSAYLTSIGKISEETLKTEDTLSNSFKRLEKTFTDFKTKVGEGTSGILKGVVDLAGGSDVGMLGVGVASLLGGKAFGRQALGGLGKALGLPGGSGGSNSINMGGYQRSSQGIGSPVSPVPRVGNLAGPSYLSRVGGFAKDNAGTLGAAAYFYGQSRGDEDMIGKGSSLAGAGGVGLAMGGPIGAALAVIAESGRQIYSAVSGKKDLIGTAKSEGEDNIDAIRVRGAKLEAGIMEVEAARKRRRVASEGSAQDYMNQTSDALEDAGFSEAAANTVGSAKARADSAALRFKARELSAKGYTIASAQYGSSLTQYQAGLGFDPFNGSSGGAMRDLGLRERSINSRISTLTAGGANDEAAQVSQLKAELANIRREKLDLEQSGAQKRSDFFGGSASLSNTQAQGGLLGGSLSDYTRYTELQKIAVDDQIRELEIVKQIAEKHKSVEGVLKAENQIQALKNQKSQIELEQTAKSLQLLQNRFTLQQKTAQLGTLKGAGSTLTALNAESGFVGDQLEMERKGQIKLSYEQKLALQQRKGELDVDTRFQKNVALPLQSAETQRQAYEVTTSAAGAIGAQEQLEMAKQRLDYLKQEIELQQKNGNVIDKNAQIMNEANQKALEIQITKIKSFGQEQQQLNFQKDVNAKQLQIAQLTKNPFVASRLYREQIELSKKEIEVLNKKLEVARSQGKGEDSLEVQNIKSEIMSAKVNVAQQLDFQRRTFAEQFTAQTINMPTGSYLFPGATSDAQNLGSAYYEGISQNGPKMNNRTYQSQVAGIFGEGASERSSYEELAGSIIDGLSSNDTVLNVRLVDDNGANTKHAGNIP